MKRRLFLVFSGLFLTSVSLVAFPSLAKEERVTGTNKDPGRYEAKASHSVENGIYVISSQLNRNLKLDVCSASKADGTNIQLYQGNDNDAQKFRITDRGQGLYSIENINSKKMLDVDSAQTKDGTNVHQWSGNYSLAQRWIIEKNQDGSYSFVSAINRNASLDVLYAQARNGANIDVYAHNGTAAQKFYLETVYEQIEPEEGVYQIHASADSNMVLDLAGANRYNYGNADLYCANGTRAQLWSLRRNGDGSYRIYSLSSGKVLEVSNANRSVGANVAQYNYNGTLSQKWHFLNLGKNQVAIVSNLTGQYLDIDSGKLVSGNNIHIWPRNDSKAQSFSLVKADGRSVVDGTYAMAVNGKGNHMYAEVRWGERRQRANIQTYQGNGTMGQKFRFQYQGNGFYKISSVLSKHVLDVESASRADDANVQTYGDNGTNAQRWIISQNADGSYAIINANSSKVLDVTSGNVVNFGNIHQYEFNNSGAQHFFLENTSGQDRTGVDRGEVNYPRVGNFTGLAQSEGKTYFIRNGHVDWNYVGSYQGAPGARWLHVEGGIIREGDVLTTEEVDAKARAVLNRVGWDLRAAFNYAMVERYEKRPLHSNFVYYANDGFDHNRREGNCYTMASMFVALARQMGYEAHQIEGGVPLRNGGINTHSWAEINMNGTWYVCDPDFQQETHRNGYMIHYGQSGTWKYVEVKRMPIR